MTKFVSRLTMSSVLIEQRIIIFSYFRIQLINFDLRLRKVINVVLNRGSVMAFCAKIFLHESLDIRWIIRSHKSQLVIYCFQSLANFPLALSFSHETAAKASLYRQVVKRTGRILAEYYLRIQYIRPLGSGTTPGLHLSISLALHFGSGWRSWGKDQMFLCRYL